MIACLAHNPVCKMWQLAGQDILGSPNPASNGASNSVAAQNLPQNGVCSNNSTKRCPEKSLTIEINNRRLQGRILPFLFLEEKIFGLCSIFAVAFIKYENISILLNVKTFFPKKEAVILIYLQQPLKLTCPPPSNNSVYGAFVT